MKLRPVVCRSFAAPALLAVIAAQALTGCSRSDGHGVTSAGQASIPVPAVTVAVVDPGAQPRRTLAVRPPAGTIQHATMTSSAQVEQTLADQPTKDFSTPELTLPLSAHVTASEPDMSNVELTLVNPSSPSPALNATLQTEKGAHAGITLTPDGAISTLRISPPTDADDITRAAVEQGFYQAIYTTVALPTDPVGVGATWTTHQHFTSAVELDQTMSVKLAALQGDTATLDVTVSQQPTSSVWMMPGNGRQLHIDDYQMKGGGTVTLDLARPLPVAGDITVNGDQLFRVPDTSATVAQRLRNHIHWGR